MRNYFCILSLLFFDLTLQAQHLDTLLAEFYHIDEVYPLSNGEIIVVGFKDDIKIERRDKHARIIWSTSLVSTDYDFLYDIKFSIIPEDSTIQVLTNYKSCDAYYYKPNKSFTVGFDGMLKDQQDFSKINPESRVFLLTGQSNRPRIAYTDSTFFVVQFANGDTLHTHLTWAGGDTTNYDLIGQAKQVTICPDGDLFVQSTSLCVFYLQFDVNRYKVVDQSLHNYANKIYCLGDDTFVEAHEYGFSRWDQHLPTTTFYRAEGEFWYPNYRPPYFITRGMYYSHGPDFTVTDSVYLLDESLSVLESVETPAEYLSSNALIDTVNSYYFNGGNIFYDHGFLTRIDRKSLPGPGNYDVELVDFEIGAYDSVYWVYAWGGQYHYQIPELTVTVRNNGEYVIENVIVRYNAPQSICSDTIWEREITQFQLQPGETKSATVHDVFLRKYLTSFNWDRECIYVLRPDRHLDDNFDDNKICKKTGLIPAPGIADPFPIHHYPSIIQDEIRFLSPVNLDFELRILDARGILLYEDQLNTLSGARINASIMTPGIYFLQFTIPSLQKTYVEKILKI